MANACPACCTQKSAAERWRIPWISDNDSGRVDPGFASEVGLGFSARSLAEKPDGSVPTPQVRRMPERISSTAPLQAAGMLHGQRPVAVQAGQPSGAVDSDHGSRCSPARTAPRAPPLDQSHGAAARCSPVGRARCKAYPRNRATVIRSCSAALSAQVVRNSWRALATPVAAGALLLSRCGERCLPS
jgi:hypothetical protein